MTAEKESSLREQFKAMIKNPPPRRSAEQIKAMILANRVRIGLIPPRPVPPYGPGTELSKMLHRLGIHPGENCTCKKHADTMNRNGSAWCGEHVDEIVGWLEGEAKSRSLPFSRTVAKKMVQLAIWKAKRLEPPPDAIHVHHTANGLGDAICGLYAVCGLADATGKHVVYHSHSAEFLKRAKHPNVTVVPIEFGARGPDMNDGMIGYYRQVAKAPSRVSAYCENLANALTL